MEGNSAPGRFGKPLPYDLRGITLLYVEDEADASNMVSKMIVMNYPQVALHTAENGAVGLEMYREHAPDIVMTDINMPVMDGIRMARERKSIDPEAHIVAVTAHSDTSYLLSAIEIGIHNYVLKPINYDELFAVTDKILEQIVLKRTVEEQNRSILQSQRQLSDAQRIAHLGSWQLDLADGSMSWSDELYRIFGIEPHAVSPSYPGFLDRFLPDEREIAKQKIREAIDGRHPVDPHFWRVVRPEGTLRTLRIEAEVVLDGTGLPETIIGTSLDVTEIKEAEEKILTLTDELERRVARRTSLLQASVTNLANFSHLVSHDLRAPVARLEGLCRAMVEDCGTCSNAGCRIYAERVERVVREIKRIIDAFNQLSHYARCRITVEEVDLSAIVGEIAAGLFRKEPARKVDFIIAADLTAQGDPRLLRTALERLLANAWKFTSKTVQGRIEFGRLEQDGLGVFFVRDNGEGFNMNYVDKLFKPFQTIHIPGEFAWDGTGIGLATVHSIILRHGGKVWAEGEPGKGAIFYFTLDQSPEAGTFMKHA